MNKPFDGFILQEDRKAYYHVHYMTTSPYKEAFSSLQQLKIFLNGEEATNALGCKVKLNLELMPEIMRVWKDETDYKCSGQSAKVERIKDAVESAGMEICDEYLGKAEKKASFAKFMETYSSGDDTFRAGFDAALRETYGMTMESLVKSITAYKEYNYPEEEAER